MPADIVGLSTERTWQNNVSRATERSDAATSLLHQQLAYMMAQKSGTGATVGQNGVTTDSMASVQSSIGGLGVLGRKMWFLCILELHTSSNVNASQ